MFFFAWLAEFWRNLVTEISAFASNVIDLEFQPIQIWISSHGLPEMVLQRWTTASVNLTKSHPVTFNCILDSLPPVVWVLLKSHKVNNMLDFNTGDHCWLPVSDRQSTLVCCLHDYDHPLIWIKVINLLFNISHQRSLLLASPHQHVPLLFLLLFSAVMQQGY